MRTRLSMPLIVSPVPRFFCRMFIVNTVCDREDTAFIFVSCVARSRNPSCVSPPPTQTHATQHDPHVTPPPSPAHQAQLRIHEGTCTIVSASSGVVTGITERSFTKTFPVASSWISRLCAA